ncbi:ABC transporter substrate-binding protein [Undibacterium sp. 5I1]|uniref:ABC transporter substrate-binding protein n=1 Tax=unclassified Undibacterium TaxID=2630295 RepID=UPI002AB52B51|nr:MULTISPECIES: ABC transporter substrate-binding protein [unclassified Undibacterium]MDY7536770.1 ABC transporter substrate-binding protein [Undibacterium sp. 5I1]MEB0231558.1 ABC transporter substrate-binding protein [Undibacterium sp. 10I3]MEB0256652.1 ABC transporter substrate-binding protein [Undibacterium sp. 5I1]
MKAVLKLALKPIAAMLMLVSSMQVHAADKITIMVGGIEKQIYLPAKLAEQLGYLKETGLEIELLSEPAGVNAETEMLSGAAQGVVGFYDHTIDLQARGKLVQSVVQFSQAPGEVILVSKAAAKEIKSPADFKGKTLGVTGLGSSTNFLTQYLAAKAGVKNSEFTTLPVGAGSTFIAAMAQNKIDAGMTTEPTISRLVSTGAATILIDLRTVKETEAALGGTYPAACLYMPTAWVNTHKDQVQKLANAFVKTLKYIKTHSAKEIADKMPADYYASNKQMYIDALEASKQMFTADGVMPENGPATVLKVLNGFDKAVQGKTINLANTFTSEFVKAAK